MQIYSKHGLGWNSNIPNIFVTYIFLLIFLYIGLFLPAPGFTKSYHKSTKLKKTAIIFHAGSLSVPFGKIEREFESKYPWIDIQREPAGSLRCIRKITDLKKPCDIIASADYNIIDKFLIPKYASFNIRFATNQLVLCYTNTSKYANKISTSNWYNILLKRGVVWGHSDPSADPCGYRALMVMQLAEKYYKKPNLYKKLVNNRPIRNIRPKSVELIALLQTGNMDYAWEYLSVAVQHNLRYVILPDKINLGNYAYNDFYSQATVKIAGKSPGKFTNIAGKSITYGITLLKSAPNKNAAILFLKYMLNPEKGLKILKEEGQPPIIPCVVSSVKAKSSIPCDIRKFIKIDKQPQP